ncbi:MAG TPA: peptide ABC transporter permease, partial [Thiomicrospira sp.]|nr:peptide ABC transporter permease [Thiomicrospira sp.]
KSRHAVFQSKILMISRIILILYCLVALIDSIQIHQAVGGTKTLLDLALYSLNDGVERTYSAPFALVEYNKSLQVSAEGISSQIYLPLQFVEVNYNFVLESLIGLVQGLVVAGVLIGLHLFWRSRVTQKNAVELPWSTAYITLLIIFAFIGWMLHLSNFVYVMGTDKVGSDVLYGAIKSIRTGVLIGVLTTIVTLPLAIVLGITAGLLRGWVDDVIQYIYTTLNSIPGVLLIASAVLVMQTIMTNNPDWFSTTEERADIRLLFLVLILGITSWTGLCRLLRAETLKISQVEYVDAAKAFGVSRFKIITRHIMPNLMHIILITLVLDFSGLVLAEAVLSYVGVGVDSTMHSWGNMINQARLEMAREPMVWWSLLSAFFFMFLLVLAANLFADRVQKVLDPRR